MLKEPDRASIGLTVRPARRADMADVAFLANQFNAALGHGGEHHEPGKLAEYCFGDDAFLRILVAEAVGRVRGYLTYHRGFDPFVAAPMYWMADFYVAEDWRGRGFGAAMLAALADDALRSEMQSIWWGVDRDNDAGRRFYQRHGARDFNDSIYALGHDAVVRLAARHRPGGAG